MTSLGISEQIVLGGTGKALRESFRGIKRTTAIRAGYDSEYGICGLFSDRMGFYKICKRPWDRSGPGRGSAAGSIVSYCLEITNIDPIRYQLLFERFLNPERVTMPDIDVDFCFRNQRESD